MKSCNGNLILKYPCKNLIFGSKISCEASCKVVPTASHSHDVTILLQPCVVNLVTFTLHHDLLEPP